MLNHLVATVFLGLVKRIICQPVNQIRFRRLIATAVMSFYADGYRYHGRDLAMLMRKPQRFYRAAQVFSYDNCVGVVFNGNDDGEFLAADAEGKVTRAP